MQAIKLEKQPQGLGFIDFFGLKNKVCFLRFGHYSHGGHWGFNDYNRWREQDGMLCRSSMDCSWMDQNMHCEDYELDFSINVRNADFKNIF